MKYFTSGFITLQDKIEQAIIRHQTNRTGLPGIYMQQFPSPCSVFDTFFMAIAQLFPLFMVLSFVYTCAMIVKSIVREKEQRLKETMRTMGLTNAVHWVAWFLDSFIFMFFICILLTIVLVVSLVLLARFSHNPNLHCFSSARYWKTRTSPLFLFFYSASAFLPYA